MTSNRFICFLLFALAVCIPGLEAAELTYRVTIQNQRNTTVSNVPVTFAHPFRAGDIPAGRKLSGLVIERDAVIDLQVDRPATHPDGSLRHAVVSLLIPSLGARESLTLELRPGDSGLAGSRVSLSDVQDSGQTVEVILRLGEERYRATLAEAVEKPVGTWLEGGVATEWITDVPFRRAGDGESHSDLRARFYVRKYAGVDNVKVDVVVENLTTFVGTRRRFDYEAEVLINGSVVFAKADITHFLNTRWKYTFWTGGEPGVHIVFDPLVLMATRAIPAYDPDLIGRVGGGRGVSTQRSSPYIDHGRKQRIDRYGPMGRGSNTTNSMASTGGRPEIAPLPRWTADWILSQAAEQKLAMIRNSDLAGSWSIHFRDERTGLPVTIDERYGGYPAWGAGPGRPNPRPVETAPDAGSPLRADQAHQPQFSFVPYLVTGDFFHLEELEFWAAYNLASANPGQIAEPNTASGDGFRNKHKGLITNRGQLRARAWNLRTLAMIAAFAPDSYPTKRYWEEILENNIARFYPRYVVTNEYGWGIHRTPDGTQPWMDDYMTWAMGYTFSLGYRSARRAAHWKARFPVARMGQGPLDSEWCWQAATDSKLGMHPSEGSLWPTINDWWAAYMPEAQGKACNTREIAAAIGVSGPGDMRGRPGSATSYVAQMGMALATAVDLGAEGAAEAWGIYSGASGERKVFPDFRGSPQFAIVPVDHLPIR